MSRWWAPEARGGRAGRRPGRPSLPGQSKSQSRTWHRWVSLTLVALAGSACLPSLSQERSHLPLPAQEDPSGELTAAPGPRAAVGAADTLHGGPSLASYREACRIETETDEEGKEEDRVEETRRLLEEGACTAVLWVDGLFGPHDHVPSARSTSGRVEVSSRYSQAGGVRPDLGLTLRYDLPNLERRVNMFLDRENTESPVADRRERFPVRSRVAPAGAERWLAGLGLTPGGRFRDRVEVRAGIRPSSQPAVFAQLRGRQQIPRGPWSEIHLRQTGFWESRQGFGITAGTDFQHLPSPVQVIHLGLTGTLSEASNGVEWRSEGAYYRRLTRERTIGGEIFARGATSRAVPLIEYGIHGSFQRPLRHPHLMGGLIAGYSWPREEAAVPRERSFLIGVRLELGFGTE
jgi:hypothetical protein